MNTAYELLEHIISVVSNNDECKVFNDFNTLNVEKQRSDIYATIGIKEIKSNSSFKTPSACVCPLKITFCVTVLCSPNTAVGDIYSYFDSFILERVMQNFCAYDFMIRPLEFNDKLGRLQLYCEFTVAVNAAFPA